MLHSTFACINVVSMENDYLRMSDNERDEIWAEAHGDCIQCGEDGCCADACPSESCDIEKMVEHEREHMHKRCIAAFDAEMTNGGAL